MTIKAEKNYLFTKLGNVVRVIALAPPYRGLAMWDAERTDGASAGKWMDVPAASEVDAQLD